MDFDTFQPNDTTPLHAQIRDWLLGQLAAYSLESKLPTDRQLAHGLGVAPLTVKRVMGDLERDGYVVRHQGRGTFLASRERRVHPDSRRAEENGEIIIAYPNYFSYEYWALVHHAETLALKAGLGLVEFKMNPTTTYEALFELIAKRPRVRGLLIAPIPGSIDRTIFERLDALGMPVAVFAHCGQVSIGQHVYSVTPDRGQAGYLAVEYLIERGHTQIARMAHEPSGQDGGENLRGMRQCLKDHGLTARNLTCVRSGIKPWESSVKAAYALCDTLQDRAPVTAIITDSVAGTMGCIRYCLEHGIAVPDQFSLISCGPTRPYDEYVFPAIVSVYAPYSDLMEQAFAALMAPDKQITKALRCPVILEDGASVADLRTAPDLANAKA